MSDSGNTMDVLTHKVVEARRHGYSMEEIAVKEGITVLEAVNAWKEYVDNRMAMPPEEQWVLHLLRLEHLLVQVNDRITYASKAEDYELVVKLLDRIAALQALNLDLKKDAGDKLAAITKAQTQLILAAVFSIADGLHHHIEAAFANGKTIKAIKGEVLGENFRQVFNTEAQRALSEGVAE